MRQTLIIYTREPIDNILYDPKLAYSMHLGYVDENQNVIPLNHNSGVFFAKASENEDGSLNPKSLINPFVFQQEDYYGLLAIRMEGNGEDLIEKTESDNPSQIREEFILKMLSKCNIQYCFENLLYARTKDFVHFEEIPFTNQLLEILSKPIQDYFANQNKRKEQEACYNTGDVPGIVFSQAFEIPDQKMEYIQRKLLTPELVDVQFPEHLRISSKEELEKIYATGIYSDTTQIPKKVSFDYSKIDFSKKGIYSLEGTVINKHFDNPIAINRADPDIIFYQGKYYYIATNDADHEHSMYVRESETLEGIRDAKDHLILNTEMYEDIKGLLWAPEFHIINNRLYIFHAATRGEFFAEESRLMVLKEGGNPLNASDWSKPVRIVKMDGSELCEEGKVITLDMTCFEWANEYYVIWSQREFLPKDLGAWLYIAKCNPEKPWMLASEPIVLSKPDYGWGNNHTFVEEGPFALKQKDCLYITFSAAAVDTSYVVSYLKIDADKDLLVPSNWIKNNYPILTARSVSGEYGTGHNAYVTDEMGTVWNTYHARFGTDAPRSSSIRRVHFDIDGAPMLDVTEEHDCKENLSRIHCSIEII